MLPITGRYNETKKKVDNLRQLISDSELLFVDTRDGRAKLVEATRAFEQRDFDRVDLAVKEARGLLEKEIPARMSEEIKKAKVQLVEAKEKGANITPMLTQLKTAISLMKSSDYGQALKEMREFKDMMKKAK
jgi:cellobiose-specific phosphotransferase system component IIA